ncbi:DUF3515 domain-containing protein [Mycobacterium sp. CBMA271]|uniref:DUF3515 domain-containing protein n=1 Tax=unclassified Mycobacteroides TaxID=2618759 RepID=UPI00132C17F7|nr:MULTISPECIES: DUF3515 domain-containing protein [unclassified Mycobacteroides]MUM16795.1 hypothetical protein [Mycobacteroides sp. CBMA 326]MUM20268.1 DUF3515 domain-containing protein [Mycobacteroides sp. CBMA 271]
MQSEDGPPRKLLIGIAVFGAIAVLAVLFGVLKYAHLRDDSRPIVVPDIPSPQANSPKCIDMSKAYPVGMAGDWKRVEIVQPAPASVAAWRRGNDSVVARCGVDRPAEFAVGTSVAQVNGVQWFRVTDAAIGVTTWFAVDRGVYIALTTPDSSGSEPLTEMSNAITKVLPAVTPDPAPLPR